jgi:prepilin-type N-terminal cleavage/methylation domain-containing protein
MQGNSVNSISHIKISIDAEAEVLCAEAMMAQKSYKKEAGFSMVEVAVVVLIVGVIIAFATPKITNAMREYRLDQGIRQVVDAIKRAKAQAVANNKTACVIADTANNRLGLFVFNNAGDVIRTDYVSLPQDIEFALPPSVVAPFDDVPVETSVSFPLKSGSTTLRQMDFTTRGFPDVDDNAMNAIYLGNGTSYRAVTLNSYGATRTWWWRSSEWKDSTN